MSKKIHMQSLPSIKKINETQQQLERLESKAESASNELCKLLQELSQTSQTAVSNTLQHVNLYAHIVEQIKVDTTETILAGENLMIQSQQLLQKLSGVKDLHVQVTQLKKQVDELLSSLIGQGLVVLKEDDVK
eukprot:TRINITY_DN30978_c0_g1_i2.p3 TRINITY_DN30978_c0_g1~~TRINITY_DN30978_c0_g1_i2.p3  ORF type:complete len:133 (+),score=12.59 TRINITY_DN30978_c0_g1_i2:298-696(+)